MEELLNQKINRKSVQTFVEFCHWLSTDQKTLNKAFQRKKEYQTFSLSTKNNKKRVIQHPNEEVFIIQKRIAKQLNKWYQNIIPDAAHGFIPKNMETGKTRDIFSNAAVHINSNSVFNIDIEDFFPSIHKTQIKDILTTIYPNFTTQIIEFLVNITTFKNQLPIGSPSSPIISNLVCLKLDITLQKFCTKNNLKFSRYVDDMSFSSDSNKIDAKLQEDIIEQIENLGFKINPNKRKYYDYKTPKEITGLIIDHNQLKPAPNLLENLQSNLSKLKELKKTYQHFKMLGNKSSKLKYNYKRLKNGIKGQIMFLERIVPKNDQLLVAFKKEFLDIQNENHYITEHIYF